MTKEELIKISRENLRKSKQGSLCECYDEAFIKGYELSKKRIAELEHQLTHRNCLDCSNHSSNLRMRNLALEKENAELKKELEMSNKVYNDNLDYSHHIEGQLTEAKRLLASWISDKPYTKSELKDLIADTEQFLKDKTETESEEPYYVIMNMNCDYEICRRCPKSGLFKGTYEECENWIKEKLSEVEK